MKLYFQLSDAFTVLLWTTLPLANKLTLIESGRLPSWSLLSFQVFVPETVVVLGVCVLVTVKLPFLPLTDEV